MSTVQFCLSPFFLGYVGTFIFRCGAKPMGPSLRPSPPGKLVGLVCEASTQHPFDTGLYFTFFLEIYPSSGHPLVSPCPQKGVFSLGAFLPSPQIFGFLLIWGKERQFVFPFPYHCPIAALSSPPALGLLGFLTSHTAF